MKYVKTSKDWIIQKTSLYKIKNNHLLQECECGYIDCGEVIAQTDTIEELCDCYSYDTETTKDYLVACSWKLHNKEREIFGCIKTNKGLIYVAKMNDKGELELL